MFPLLDQTPALVLSDDQPELVEPLTLDEVKLYLRVETSDDDALVEMLISGARETAELLQRRVLVRKSYDLHIYTAWPFVIDLVSPVASVDLVQVTAHDGSTRTLTPVTDYTVDIVQQPALLHPQWSVSGRSMLVRFTAGYAPTDPFWRHTGQRIKAGMLMLIAAWYSNRIPFSQGSAQTELPYAITHCLSSGARWRV